jgi:hypothetical protein
VSGVDYALYTLPTTRKFQKRQQQLYNQHHQKFESIKRRTPAQMREERDRMAAISRRHSEILVEELALSHRERLSRIARPEDDRKATEDNDMDGQLVDEASGKSDTDLYATLKKRPSGNARTMSCRKSAEKINQSNMKVNKGCDESRETCGSGSVMKTEITMQEDFSSIVAIDKVIVPQGLAAEERYDEAVEDAEDGERKRLKKCIYGGEDGFKILSVEVLRDEQRQQY